MILLAVDIDGTEIICNCKLERSDTGWVTGWFADIINPPQGTIKRLIGDQLLKTHGRDHLTWEDAPVEFNEVAE
jgi:hypothetical protein